MKADARRGLSLWLDRLMLRSDLDAEERDAVLSLPGEIEAIRTNRDFVRLGEQVDRSCLILSGLAGRFGQTRDGGRQITALHIPGEMADLHSAVLPEAATALQSVGEAVIYRVPHDAIRALEVRYPALGRAFWRDCVVDAAVLSQWALVNARLSARSRVAHLIAELSCRVAITECRDGGSFDWPLTQIHLGDATGLTSVHVNRMLRLIAEAGAAEIQGKRIAISDWELLTSIGEFDPRYLHLKRAE